MLSPLSLNPFALYRILEVLVVVLLVGLVVSLLFEIRNNTRRTAEAVERLADQRETDDSDGPDE